jgi:hypothetical protein
MRISAKSRLNRWYSALRHFPGVLLVVACTSIIWPAPANADTFTLLLNTPDYGSCGDVSINGYVSTSAGVITRMSWDWGDGAIVDSWFPASHSYDGNGDYTVVVTAYSSTGATHQESTSVSVTSADNPLCSYSVRVCPETVVLRGGVTSDSLKVEIRGSEGQLISTDGYEVVFSSSNETLVQVDENGVVSSTGFGEVEIEATVVGIPRTGKGRVYAGNFRVEPPILVLSMDGHTTGQLVLSVANADGSEVSLDGRTIQFRGGNEVASVDANGLVTAQRAPQSFNETPYIDAVLDGSIYSDNAAVIRVTSSTLGLAMNDYTGTHVAFRVAEEIGPYPFDELMSSLQVLQVTDSIYLIEQWLTGFTPSRGDTQFLVLDPGYNTDGTVPCGTSGNPIRLGTAVDNLDSCFGGTDWIQWGIIGHEMGHNFLNLQSFWEWMAGLSNSIPYSEGMASTLGIYAIQKLIKNPTLYGLEPDTIQNLSSNETPLTPNAIRNYFYPMLATYEAAPDYANNFDADILTGIMTKLLDEYGSRFLFRFMSVFYPSDRPLPVNLNTETEHLVFFVAACSAAANADLRARFHDQWGFPSDNDFYDSIYDQVSKLALQRDPAVKTALPCDFEGIGKSNLAVYRPGSGVWYGLSAADPGQYTATQWGTGDDLVVNGDYDGDGKADQAVWRPGSGVWFVLPSDFPGTYRTQQWGLPTDLPVPADYDGDGKTDIAVWRPGSGIWYIRPTGSPNTYFAQQWGSPSDIPVPADYDGDGRIDISVWRPGTGVWYILPSGSPGLYYSQQWGLPSDKPVPGDYDGDSKADVAVWRPDSGVWYILPSYTPASYIASQWGLASDIPTPADYDGDGRTDIAVWRPDAGVWYLRPSSTPTQYSCIQWGMSGDTPLSPATRILGATE